MLTENEMKIIKEQLERNPSEAEKASIDALWSEHCSYKSSKRWFHLFNTESERVVLGIGEGAGLIDVGDGYVIGLGIESHNHPSAVDPFNGAATGVGGIIRDIVSQGCRPVAVLDCLRFGLPITHRQKLLLDQVILGISSYGNCVGVPNLGGDVEFAVQFETNPLVNAMCVGVTHKNDIIRSIAATPGDKLLLFGSASGRDGIGGVTFASEDLDENQQENRGSVQIGDPLTEKILIDAIIELRDKKLLSGLQDLGGGGLVCASAEMSEKGTTGVELDLDKVILTDDNMQGWEILISESQERMLAVVSPEHIDEVCEILDKYDLQNSIIGSINNSKQYVAKYHGKTIVNVEVDFLVNGFQEPHREIHDSKTNLRECLDPVEIRQDIHPLEILLNHYNLASRISIYEQYDQHVQGNTVTGAERDAGVIILPNGKFLAIAAGANSYITENFGKVGAELSALSIIRKTIARGGVPIAIVDSINAGNPERPESYGQFVGIIKGIAEVSHKLKIPVVGGNVSLYNESEQNGKITKIYPSPFVGITSLIESNPIPSFLRSSVSLICRIGAEYGYINGSEYQRIVTGKYVENEIIKVDYDLEHSLITFFSNERHQLLSATPIGKGGLLVTAAKWAIQSDVGLTLDLDTSITCVYGENTASYILQINPSDFEEIKNKYPGLMLTKIGEINDTKELKFDKVWDINELRGIWESPINSALNRI